MQDNDLQGQKNKIWTQGVNESKSKALIESTSTSFNWLLNNFNKLHYY